MNKREMAKLRNATPAELVAAHSDAMLTVELIWQEAARRLDETAGSDRLCACATASGKARSMMHRAKAFHADADVMAAELGALLPGGDGVPMPAFGSR